MHITVGSRKSQLALKQTDWVLDRLKEQEPELSSDVEHIVTRGDKILNVTLSKVGGKGLFVKEIEQAMFDGRIDLAVHSMKDMPAEMPDGLDIVCVPERVDYRDAFISVDHVPFASLPEGSIIGTSSLRRGAQLLAKRPDLTVKPIRGNIDTRLRKLQEEDFDAIVLAAAGLERMGWSSDVVTEFLPVSLSLPAVGQGALAIEARTDDEDLRQLLEKIHDPETALTVSAERSFLAEMEGGCTVPIAGYCERLNETRLKLTGLVGTPDGKVILQEEVIGSNPINMGIELANSLKERGAGDILDRVKKDLDNS